MKLAVFNEYRIGIVEGDAILDVTNALPRELDAFPSQRMNWLIGKWKTYGGNLREMAGASKLYRIDEVRLLSPSPAPSHLFAAPANYRKHLNELGSRSVSKGRTAREQGFFLKAPGSLVGSGNSIELPRGSARRFDHESELAVIVGRAGRNIPRAEAMQYVFGYSCLIDGTMRIEPGTGEEERSMRKSFATFTPLGPFLVTADEISNPHALSNRLSVNGEIRQDANTRDMIVDIPELIELISSVLPISPGDVIATGTPEGVGPIVDGDTVTIEIEQVGKMAVSVRQTETVAPRPY